MGGKHIDAVCNEVLTDTFDANKDPITAIIINAYANNNNYCYTEEEKASFVVDLDYAISQLKKAQTAMSTLP